MPSLFNGFTLTASIANIVEFEVHGVDFKTEKPRVARNTERYLRKCLDNGNVPLEVVLKKLAATKGLWR